MSIRLSAIFAGVFVLMLGVLGHGAWHREITGLLGLAVYLLTGAKVVG